MIETQKMRELRKRISAILVKHSMPTRQIAISEIVELIMEQRSEVWKETIKIIKKEGKYPSYENT